MRNIDSIMRHLDPNIPSFIQHPADIMKGDKSKSIRKKMTDSQTDSQKVRDETLEQLKSMGTAEVIIDEDFVPLTLEVEMLYDEEYRQLTQIGAALSEDGKKQIRFFRSILPRFMEDYNHNLILKYQNSLFSSLGMKYDDGLKKYLFHHAQKDEDVQPMSEERALTDMISFLRSYLRDKKCVVFMHAKNTYVDLLLTKIHFYKLTECFEEFIEGFCDFTTFLSQLKLNEICKNADLKDVSDVYRQERIFTI